MRLCSVFLREYCERRLHRYTPKLIPEERLQQAVDIMLSLQNPGGGFASYELIRGSKYLELLNPAEVFGNFMVCLLLSSLW